MKYLAVMWEKLERRGIFWRFVVTGTLVFIAIGYVLAGLIEPMLIDFTLNQQKLSFVVFANRIANDTLAAEDFAYPPPNDAVQERFAEFSRHLQIPGLFRIKVWGPDGTIVYSNETKLIGQKFPLHEGIRDAFDLKTSAKIKVFDPNDPHYEYESSFGEGIEAYAPITFGASTKVVGVIETYARAGFLLKEVQTARSRFAGRVTVSLVLMFAALSAIVWGASRTVERQRKELSRYASGLELLVKDRTRALASALGKQKAQSEELARNVNELAVAKAKDDSLLGSIGEGMVAVNKDAKIMFMNETAERLLGRSINDVLWKPIADIVSIEDGAGDPLPPEKDPISLALTTRRRIKFAVTGMPIQFSHKDGSRFPVAVTVAPIVVGSELQGAVMIFRDVTQEKEIDRAKTEFVSLASHQLRTPLTIINWYAEMLRSGDEGKLTPGQDRYLNEIYQGSKRLGALVNAFLNVSRLELGTFVVEPKPVNVADVARTAVKELAFAIKLKKLAVEERYGERIPEIPADTQLVQIIVHNLLTNAVKYTPPKGTVTVSVEAVEQGAIAGGRPAYTPGILVTVKDSGIGIPAKDQRKIFSKLFRADNAVEKETDGTGLGLYIIRSILDRVGGTIWFESPASPGQGGEENQGTAFYVLLPQEGMKRKEGVKGLTLENML